MTTESNVEILRTVYAAFSAGDIPTILSHLSPEVQWMSPYGPSILP